MKTKILYSLHKGADKLVPESLIHPVVQKILQQFNFSPAPTLGKFTAFKKFSIGPHDLIGTVVKLDEKLVVIVEPLQQFSFLHVNEVN